MELIKINEYYVTYQRQGNNKSGNPVFIVNIFQKLDNGKFLNMNIRSGRKLDKYGNIRLFNCDVLDRVREIVAIIE